MIAVDQLLSRVPMVFRAGLAALVLCGLILATVFERAKILGQGVTVRLATAPVDPRDLFRGDYVILDYEISRINLTRLGVVPNFRSGTTVYVGVRRGDNGKADVMQVVAENRMRDPGLTWLRGTAGGTTRCFIGRTATNACSENDQILRVRYGLESYFVPQGEGKAIETTAASRVEVLAAVSASGKAAIKSLLIDGKPVYDEPPF